MLQPDSPIPLYRQLAEILSARIRSGDYPIGSRIPSEHDLARDFGIGRPTVRQATEWLVRRHLLVRRRGAGTFVCEPRQEVDLFSLAGTTSAFHRQGIAVVTSLLQPPRLLTVAAETAENPFQGIAAYALSRLSRVDDQPVLLEDLYLDAERFAGIDRIDLNQRSLAQVVEEVFALRPTGGRQTFRIGFAEGERARTLAVRPSTPILQVRRSLHFPQAPNAIYAELFCRTDRFDFSQTIGGDQDE